MKELLPKNAARLVYFEKIEILDEYHKNLQILGKKDSLSAQVEIIFKPKTYELSVNKKKILEE